MGKLTREVVVVVEGDALEIEGIPESEYECDATERCRYEGMAVDPQTMQATKGDGGGVMGMHVVASKLYLCSSQCETKVTMPNLNSRCWLNDGSRGWSRRWVERCQYASHSQELLRFAQLGVYGHAEAPIHKCAV